MMRSALAKSRRVLPALAAAALLATASPLAAESFFSALAGPGEKVTLSARSMDMRTAPDGGITKFVGTERVVLRSPKLNLDADYLEYFADGQRLYARGNVTVEQPGVNATADELNYDIAEDLIVLKGSPVVEQQSAGSRARFTGMDEFTLKTLEDGGTNIEMQGGEGIQAEIQSTQTSAAANTGTRRGLSALGSNVNIRARARDAEQPPKMVMNARPDGSMGEFRATGSVVLESEAMDLRSDVLEFDGERQIVDALYNVFLRQEGVEADAGRMVYDLNEDIVTLSIQPIVRQQREGGVMRMSRMDAAVISRLPDGSSDIDVRPGPDGEPLIEWEVANPSAPAPPVGTAGPTEINIDDDADLQRLNATP